jgi:hypothetical protein
MMRTQTLFSPVHRARAWAAPALLALLLASGCRADAPADVAELGVDHVAGDEHPAEAHGGGHTMHGNTEPVTGPVHPGTASMVRLLDTMYAEITFEDDPWGSERRLRDLQAMPAPAGIPARIERQFRIGEQQLNAGHPKEAAATLERLLESMGTLTTPFDPALIFEIRSLIAVSWLRHGELQNCALNHNAGSCLLPLRDGGVHQDKEGAQKAIAMLQELMAERPDALQERWLLNVAHMANGTWPEGVKEELRAPASAFESDEPFPRFLDIAPELGLNLADQAGGAIVDDFTGDGNLDIMVSSIGNHDQLRFFASRGDGTFEDRTGAAGLAGLVGGLNMVQADYDGDGWLDFLILRGGWTNSVKAFPNSLVRNRGDGTFEDVTEAAGLLSFHPTQTASWGDYDNDGDLDLFIGNESTPGSHVHPSELYVNDGDGTFTEAGGWTCTSAGTPCRTGSSTTTAPAPTASGAYATWRPRRGPPDPTTASRPCGGTTTTMAGWTSSSAATVARAPTRPAPSWRTSSARPAPRSRPACTATAATAPSRTGPRQRASARPSIPWA